MVISDYDERLRKIETQIRTILDYRKDISSIRKLVKIIKKNRKYFRLSIDILLFMTTILGFLI